MQTTDVFVYEWVEIGPSKLYSWQKRVLNQGIESVKMIKGALNGDFLLFFKGIDQADVEFGKGSAILKHFEFKDSCAREQIFAFKV